MLNDSVYYCAGARPQFVADLFDSEVEALGATENFEIEHHVGSFCIAMAGRVVADAAHAAVLARLPQHRPPARW